MMVHAGIFVVFVVAGVSGYQERSHPKQGIEREVEKPESSMRRFFRTVRREIGRWLRGQSVVIFESMERFARYRPAMAVL